MCLKNINFDCTLHGTDCEALEIQVLEARLNKLVDGANKMRNQWVEVHHRDKKKKS